MNRTEPDPVSFHSNPANQYRVRSTGAGLDCGWCHECVGTVAPEYRGFDGRAMTLFLFLLSPAGAARPTIKHHGHFSKVDDRRQCKIYSNPIHFSLFPSFHHLTAAFDTKTTFDDHSYDNRLSSSSKLKLSSDSIRLIEISSITPSQHAPIIPLRIFPSPRSFSPTHKHALTFPRPPSPIPNLNPHQTHNAPLPPPREHNPLSPLLQTTSHHTSTLSLDLNLSIQNSNDHLRPSTNHPRKDHHPRLNHLVKMGSRRKRLAKDPHRVRKSRIPAHRVRRVGFEKRARIKFQGERGC